MSSSDQAKSKLLNSMRMSKQGSIGNTSIEKATAVDEPVATNKSKQSASKNTNSKSQSKVSTKSKATNHSASGSYQAAQRVWPD